MTKPDLTGQTALITGASKGIGAAAARAFAAAGANVVLLARSADSIAALATEIGPRARAIPSDVIRYDDVAAAVATAESAFGQVDILINNAGTVEPISHLSEVDPAAFAQLIDVNLMGVMHGMRAVMPGMLARGAGTIINISSGAATNAVEGWSAYCASKAAVLMLTRMGHKEAARKGLRVMGLSPGTVATDMQHKIRASGINPVSRLDWSDHIPPDWPARALVWMCTPAADAYLGGDVSLRETSIRRAVGLA